LLIQHSENIYKGMMELSSGQWVSVHIT